MDPTMLPESDFISTTVSFGSSPPLLPLPLLLLLLLLEFEDRLISSEPLSQSTQLISKADVGTTTRDFVGERVELAVLEKLLLGVGDVDAAGLKDLDGVLDGNGSAINRDDEGVTEEELDDELEKVGSSYCGETGKKYAIFNNIFKITNIQII